MRLLSGIAALTVVCMLSVAAVTDHLADTYLSRSTLSPTGRVHLINDVTQALKRAQDCRRAYLATGDNSYLSAYRVASSDVDLSMDRLVFEDHEVTTKLAHAEGMREFVHAKLSEIESALESKPAAKPLTAIPAPVADRDLARFQRLLNSLAQEESRDVSGGLEAAGARTAFHRSLVIALAAINILFLGGVAFCASQIGKLHSFITLCAWSKRVQYQGQWVPLEEYMSKRFGVRISHGISQDEYDKWCLPDVEKAPLPKEMVAPTPLPTERPAPKAAA
jgi:CHASE3 domain sensor protein